jgi:DNA-directed RNA polymerase specialized sigma24 family protein
VVHPDSSKEPDREALERMLELLDPEPEKAGRKYFQLRRRLTRLFEWRGARFPEDLVDETISRVARRLDEGVEIRSDDPYRYFCGVAHLVFKELLRERRRERKVRDPANWPQDRVPEEEPEDPRMEILQSCLDDLPTDQSKLLLEYNQGDGRERIENRRAIARRLGVPLNALRIRVHRIRAKLERCVHERVAEQERSDEMDTPPDA